MFNEDLTRELVRVFNRTSNGNLRYTTDLENKLNAFEGTITVDEVFDIVRSNPTKSIYDILNPAFIKFYKDSKVTQSKVKELEEKFKKQEEKKLEEEKSNLSLGLVEKALARVMVDEYAPKLAESVERNVDDYIKETYGPIVRKVNFEINGQVKKVEGVTHEKFETVLKFVMADEPVMLIGPAGTGKNVICKQVAKALDLDFYFSNAVTQEYKLTGFIDANGVYQETEFYKAFKNGGLFMLDEIDASIPEVLVILNAAIANRYFDFPNGKIEAHENFRVVSAGNTFGTGASYEYSGRNQLDGASLDRFAQVYIDYSPAIEESLTEDKDLIRFIRKFRKSVVDKGINHIVSYRSINRLSKLEKVMPIDELLQSCLIKNLEQDDLRMIVRDFNGSSIWEEGFRKCVE